MSDERDEPCTECGAPIDDVYPCLPGTEGLCHPECCPECRVINEDHATVVCDTWRNNLNA